MKWLLLPVFFVGLVILAFVAMTFAIMFHRKDPRPRVLESEQQRLYRHARAQIRFLSQHGYNTQLCFLVDMQRPSGQSRFFVYDLQHDSVLLSGLVAHGAGTAAFSLQPVFSNVNGSGCSSLGRYRIGNPYKGQFGLAYKLYGLDSSNSQAFNRNIVLHSYDGVPATETDPQPICNSRGCPMVSPVFLTRLQPLIDKSHKPIMLEIFD